MSALLLLSFRVIFFIILKESVSKTIYSGTLKMTDNKHCFESVIPGTTGDISKKQCSVFKRYNCYFKVALSKCVSNLLAHFFKFIFLIHNTRRL